MNISTVLNTDLLTPLAAYLHLRDSARAAFLLESVDQGRLGRYSLVGCGDRLVSFAEAEALDEPVVGYLGYDHVAVLEPTVQLPAAGNGLPESRFVVADVLVRFDHTRNIAEVLDWDSAPDLTAPAITVPPFVPETPCGSDTGGPASSETEWTDLRRMALDMGWELPL